MRFFRNPTTLALFALVCLARNVYGASDKDRNALEKTSEAIRAAFARGNVAGAMEYHHPEVMKALRAFANCEPSSNLQLEENVIGE